MALNTPFEGEQSIAMVVFITSANASGIIKSQLFHSADALLYRTGWTVIVALVPLAPFLTISANVQHWISGYGIGRKRNYDAEKKFCHLEGRTVASRFRKTWQSVKNTRNCHPDKIMRIRETKD